MYLPREEGQGLVEYALILVLVAVVVSVTFSMAAPCSSSHSRLGLSAPVGHTPTHCPQNTQVVAGIGLSKNVPIEVSKPRPVKLMA